MKLSAVDHLGAVLKKVTKTEQINGAVARCQKGDPQAFRQLFEDHVSGVHRHLTLLIGPGPDIDDVMQLVFLNVFQSIRNFKGQSSFSTWLFRITANIAHQEIRMKGRLKRLGSVINEASKTGAPSVEQTPERSISTFQQIYGVLDQLSWKKRETFVLYAYEGYSLEEIAQLLDSSVSTIGSRLQAARRDIIKILNGRRGR